MSPSLVKRRPFLAIVFDVLWWLAMRIVFACCAAALVFFGWRYVAKDRLDEEIRTRIEAKFREHYSGLIVTVDSARRVEGHGIEIRGLTITEPHRPGNEVPMLTADRILASCSTDLTEFLSQEPEVKSIVVKRPRIRAIRRADGQWNIRHLFPLPVFGNRTPPAVLEDAAITVSDESQPEREEVNVRDLKLSLIPETDTAKLASQAFWLNRERPPLRLEGSFSGDFLESVHVRGYVDPRAGYWDLQGSVEGLAFTPKLRASLPRDLAAELAPLAAVSGNTHFNFAVDNLRGFDSPWRFHLAGTIDEGRIDDDRLPHSITEAAARIECDNSGFRVEDLRGKFGGADLQLSLKLDGYGGTSPLVLRIGVTELPLDETLAAALPPGGKRFWDSLAPSGALTGKFTIEFDGETWNPSCECNLSDFSLTYEKFRYRLTDGAVNLKLLNDLLTIRGQAWAGNTAVNLEGEIRNAGPDWYGWGEFRTTDSVPVDERLLSALPTATRTIVEDMRARGFVDLLGRMDRRPGGVPRRFLEVSLKDCSVNYRHFAYPIDHISGTMRGTDSDWTFTGLNGTQGGGKIACEGKLDLTAHRLELDFTGRDVPLDEALRNALPEEERRLWNEIRPRGSIDQLTSRVRYDTAAKELAVEIDGVKLVESNERDPLRRELRIEPVWFPYSLDIRAGSMKYRDGSLELTEIRADHGRTRFEADGSCRWDQTGKWSLKLNRLHSDRLQLDHDLLAALPTDAGHSLANAKLSGAFGMLGNASMSGVAGDLTQLNAQWDLSFDWEDGRLEGDTPIEHIHGGVRLVGGVERGQWFSRGDIEIDSLFVRGVQLTKVRGPLYVDRGRLVLGQWAERDLAGGAPRQITAQCFEGLIAADASLSLGDDGKFALECSLDQGDLAVISRELNLPAENLSGKTFGSLQVTGTTRGKHTWRGGGNVRLRDAYLYKVPVMVAMLKLLSIRTPDSTAFTTSDIDFRIQGDDLVFDHIDLSGDAISLKGRGRLFEQKQIDLLFYTQMGRNELQPSILRPIMSEAGPYFLLIEVTGTVDDPKVKKTAFPAINETLRQLFPDLARTERSETPSTSRTWPTLPKLLPK